MSAQPTSPTGESATAPRQAALRALALAPPQILRDGYAAIASEAPAAQAVRGPEIGLVMLRGRAGGGGAAFNLGEASVCRATVRLESGEVGHAMILGRDRERARVAAHCDALWQVDAWRERIEREILEPARAADAQALQQRAEESEATRVDFFTLARGED